MALSGLVVVTAIRMSVVSQPPGGILTYIHLSSSRLKFSFPWGLSVMEFSTDKGYIRLWYG